LVIFQGIPAEKTGHGKFQRMGVGVGAVERIQMAGTSKKNQLKKKIILQTSISPVQNVSIC